MPSALWRQQHCSHGGAKHGDGSIMLWGCFTISALGTLHKVDVIKKAEDYPQIRQSHVRSAARQFKLKQIKDM